MGSMLRPLLKTDELQLLVWRNNPYFIARSGTRATVSKESHREWFARVLNDERSLAFMIEVDAEAVGHLRFDLRQNDECVVTIYLLESHTSRGYGVSAIIEGCSLATERWPKVSFIAEVRQDNMAGRKAFLKAGFRHSNLEAGPAGDLMRFCKPAYFIDEQHTRTHYTKLFDAHGSTHLALNWGSEYTQNLRFSILAEVGDLKGVSVLDVGSGLGDFAGWLDRRSIDVNYVGLDLTPVFVKQSQQKYPGKRFVCGSILDPEVLPGEEFDFVFASGIFATYGIEGSSWMKRAIQRMWRLARFGIVFNSLSSWSQTVCENEYLADPLEILAFCHSLTSHISFRHDYHPRDFTMFLYKKSAA